MITLATLLQGWIADSELAPLANVQVAGLELDNRQIQRGQVFVALRGTRQHGLQYAAAAVQAGAVAVLYEPDAEWALQLPALDVPWVAVPSLAQVLGGIAARFYQHPSADLFMVGVTGTDGKTSVTHFIAEALQAAGDTAAVIGTLGIGKPAALQPATHTTPNAIYVHSHLRQLKDAGFHSVAMEVSSHALDQGRVNSVTFDVAVLTNLTRDHLDYHGTVAAYAAAKRKLFHWQGLRQVVLNLDDGFGRELAAELKDSGLVVTGYGVGAAADYPVGSVVATRARFDHAGIHAEVVTPVGQGVLQAPVLGRFNLDNVLAALAVLLAKGFVLEQALAALQQIQTVPGRMQRVQVAGRGADVLVVVDYAHTPGALEQVLRAMRVHTRARLICVFGCGGDRDAGKRPLMAQIVEQAADIVIVTDDNPRTESAAQIFADIKAGFQNVHSVVFEHDRARAIQRAIQQAQAGDTVLIAGKGHETVQILAGYSQPFDDREQAILALQECAA